jgi:hypothetical protein
MNNDNKKLKIHFPLFINMVLIQIPWSTLPAQRKPTVSGHFSSN